MTDRSVGSNRQTGGLGGSVRRLHRAHKRPAARAWAAGGAPYRDPLGGRTTREALDVARYVADMAAQLETMSAAVDLDLAAYFLSMARVEAERSLLATVEEEPTPASDDDGGVAGRRTRSRNIFD